MSAFGRKADIAQSSEKCPFLTQSGHKQASGQEYRLQFVRLFRLDVGRADYLGPLLGVLNDELAQFGGRDRKWLDT